MNRTICLLIVSLIIISLSGCTHPPVVESVQSGELREQAQSFIKDLNTEVKGRLGKAIKNSGYDGAVIMANKQGGYTIASEMMKQNEGLIIRRVSFKNRNPNNIPDAYESRMLHLMEKDHANGTLKVYYEDLTTTSGEKTYKYMEPIIIKELCLHCHDTKDAIEPEVLVQIKRLYPNDKAMDYKTGDLRGAIFVTLPVSQ